MSDELLRLRAEEAERSVARLYERLLAGTSQAVAAEVEHLRGEVARLKAKCGEPCCATPVQAMQHLGREVAGIVEFRRKAAEAAR